MCGRVCSKTVGTGVTTSKKFPKKWVTNPVGTRLINGMSNPAETQRMNESELVGLAKGGCSHAFTELVRKHHQDLRGFLVRRVGNLAVADDLAQDVFLAAVRQISTIGKEGSFRAWLFTVARNKAADHLRRAPREKTNESEIEVLIAQENIARTQQQDMMDEELLMTTLKECMAKLNPRSRSLIESFYFHDESAEKIAASTNQKGNTIRMALLRTRKALAVCIRRRLGTEFEL